jgi:DNA-binding NarL/FixJ family response regulator
MNINPPKVLLVDDEPHVLQYMSNMLDSIKFKVVGMVNSGDEALSWLRDNDVDVVILDITMPGIGGDQAVPLMKKMNPELVIIMLTSRNTIEIVKQCKQDGVSGYILKNEEGDKICQRIQEIWFSRFFKKEENQ